MGEYIERDALLKEIGRRKSIARTSFPKQNFCVNDVLHCIYDAPAADVVEVVRCKDCNRWGGKYNDYGMCHCLFRQTGKNDFCSYGERKPQKDNVLRDLSGNVIRRECDKTPPEYKSSHDINCGVKMDGKGE